MKFIKYLFTILCATSLCLAASAQQAGVNTLLPGGNTILRPGAFNNVVATGVSTNQYGSSTSYGTITSNLVQSVAEYDNVGLTWSFTGFGAGCTNAAVVLYVYRSYDNGLLYEANPGFTYSCTPGFGADTATFTTNLNLAVTSATHLAFSFSNTNTVAVTNVILKVNLKPAKVYTLPARN